ncbi:MAG: PQQ-binding-like beta-propeller repeat protein [Gemmataceae bacterium]|nr:PQQ-binding-like beta-propeller repeat protein [Gemmataceae bacterium]
MTLPRRFQALACLCLLLLVPFVAVMASLKGGTDRTVISRYPPAAPDTSGRLHLHWVREYPPLTPAWPDQPRLQFDATYRPVVHNRTLYVSSSRTDSVTALDLDTGKEKWCVFVDGPVRFAPAVWRNRVYFTSDDGYLYCVHADDGRLLWKFRGGPSERKVLGNERLISTWPARGAPVLAEGEVYFAAGIWPFMGVFLHALDSRTGEVIWTNSGDGSVYMEQPHHADSFAGIAPQGQLAVAGDQLLVPCGRAVPACYDRRTGKLLHFRLAENSRLGGGGDVSVQGSVFLNGGTLFDVHSGAALGELGEPAVLGPDVAYGCDAKDCRTFDLKALEQHEKDRIDRRGQRYSYSSANLTKLSSVALPHVDALALANLRLYAGAANRVLALELPLVKGHAHLSWQTTIEGHAAHLTAADDQLIVTTREGRIYCFGPGHRQVRHYPAETAPAPPADEWNAKTAALLDAAQVREGYCIVWGVGDGRLLGELVRQSSLRIIGIDADAARVNALRKSLYAGGIGGERVALITGDCSSVALPPYLASLMVCADGPDGAGASDFLDKAFASLRPYGGVLCLSPTVEQATHRLTNAHPGRAKVRTVGDWLLISRDGAVAGSANWTHEHADAANTRVSRDMLVKAPLGLLWFGGPSHAGVLPRHGHGPQPQIIDGKAIVEGPDLLRAIDIYTGRLLWETKLPGVGAAYDYLHHQPGANATGGNYVSTPDGIYVTHGACCRCLDPATGKEIRAYQLPPLPGEKSPPGWSYLNVCDDYLLGGANLGEPTSSERGSVAGSKRLTLLDRRSGKVLWNAIAESGFRHNGVCIGAGRVYCIDRSPPDSYYRRRYGEAPEPTARLVVLDLKTGKTRWTTADDVFGTWLSYSAKHNILIESGRVARDSLHDEPRGMRAYDAATGKVIWHRPDYTGPAMIRGDMILKDHSACDVRTGAPVMRGDFLTGEPLEWTWTRGYGCNTPVASEHLLTFRSGAAGYFDLANDGGTGNFGGFRSSCTNNLIVGGGVLCAPEYTRTCTCSYQNQTSIALVPMPEAEMWTFYGRQEVKGVVRRVGINLGAPGNRRADNGTLWIEYPNVGGPSPRVPIATEPEKPEVFRQHASQVAGKGPTWIGASGVKGLNAIRVTLAPEGTPTRRYTVRLHFLEPDRIAVGQRVFDVALQGERVLSDFDVCKEAEGRMRGVVREFRGVRVAKELEIKLTPSDCAGGSASVLSGIEIVADGW